MGKVLVTDPLSEVGRNLISARHELDYRPGLTGEELRQALGGCDALLVRSGTKVTRELIEAGFGRLRVIGRAGVGVDNIDVEAATDMGIVVVNSPEGNTIAAAEHTLAMMLSMARSIPAADRSMKQGEWRRKDFMGVELHSRTLGVVGLGKIGSHVARVADAMGMKVKAYDPWASSKHAQSLGASSVDLEEIWRTSDFLTLHIPRTPDTTGLVGRDAISKMKPGVHIVNCARGGLVDEQALTEALEAGHVAGAALDVFDSEPLPPDSPLRHIGDKVLLAPHLGASTEEAQVNVALDVAEQICDILEGGFARSAVNAPRIGGELRHEISLATTLGLILNRLSRQEQPHRLTVRASGQIAAGDLSPLQLASLQGYLGASIEGVTMVNAGQIAKTRGLEVVESKTSESSSHYGGELMLELQTSGGVFRVGGVLQGQSQAFLARINDHELFLAISQHMLITEHRDRPGVIANISRLLGQRDINISSMALGRHDLRAEATMVCTLDEALPESLVSELESISEIERALSVNL